MKKYILLIVGILITVFLIGKDFIDFKRDGVNYFINNGDYTYNIENYSNEFRVTFIDFDEEQVLDVERGFKLTNYEYVDRSLLLNFSIDNFDYRYKSGHILYMYSFEDYIRSYEVNINYNGTLYQGEIFSEGPFNNDGFLFALSFDDVPDEILTVTEFVINIENFVVTNYERK